jgi:hypothetical protein
MSINPISRILIAASMITASFADFTALALSQSLQNTQLLTSHETVSSDSFVLPSGNIYCAVVGTQTSEPSLRCEMGSMLNPMPPRPRDCEFDWGAGLLLPSSGDPKVLCISDTIGGSNYTLQYDKTWKNSGFECIALTTGLSCANTSGRGFFLSREKWYTF